VFPKIFAENPPDTPSPSEALSDRTDGEKEIVEYREKKPSRPWLSGGQGLLLGVAIGMGITFVGMRVLSSGQKPANNPAAAPVVNFQAPAQSVTVAEVQTSPVNRTLKATGTVAAFEMIPVMSQATGLQIQQVLVDEGDFVQTGQLLVKLDDAVLQAQLVQAQAAVAEAEANLAKLRAGNRLEEIERAEEQVRMAQAEVKQAESDLELARKRVERNQNLEADGAIARDRHDEIINEERSKQSALNTTQAKLREAQQKLKELESGARPEEIAQGVAKLAQAKGQVQIVMAQLKDTRVIAPTSGKIAERNARVGDITSSSEKLFTIIENGRLELRVKIPETQLPLIRSGQAVEITSDVDSRLKLVGRVREINPVVNEESRQATFEVDLPTQSVLKPGMFLRASITTATATSLTVPMGAVLPQADGTAIAYVLQADETVKGQRVETGELLRGDRVEILAGLQAGDRVVVKGAAYLKDGDRISVVSNQ
jgi:multidrug efflux pump subunit AcrA (membrane-fusion protein)